MQTNNTCNKKATITTKQQSSISCAGSWLALTGNLYLCSHSLTRIDLFYISQNSKNHEKDKEANKCTKPPTSAPSLAESHPHLLRAVTTIDHPYNADRPPPCRCQTKYCYKVANRITNALTTTTKNTKGLSIECNLHTTQKKL